MIKPIYILFTFIGVLLISRYIFKLEYIKCFDIIKQHILSFRVQVDKNKKEKWLFLPIFIYFLFPLLIAGALVTIKKIDKDAINVITVIISILASMLFTLLTLVISMKAIGKENERISSLERMIKDKLLLETYYAIMFEVFICIIILFMCFMNLFSALSSIAESFVMYYLIFTMVINLFIVLKRIFKIAEDNLGIKK